MGHQRYIEKRTFLPKKKKIPELWLQQEKIKQGITETNLEN